MTNKICITLLLIVGCSHAAMSQEKESSNSRIWNSEGVNYEIGTNASFFIGNFLNITGLGDPVFNDPFGFTGRLIRNDFAFGVAIQGSMLQQDFQELDSSRNRNTVNNSLFYRAGFEYQHEVGRRWKMNVGVDYIGSTTRFVNSFSNGFEVVTSENASITHGVGPTLSFQYYISPRISLFTRSGIFYSITNGIAQTTFSVNSQNNTKTTTTSNEMEFTFPSSIFVAIQL